MEDILIQTETSFLRKKNINEMKDINIKQELLDLCIDDVKDKLEIKPPIIIRERVVNQKRDVGFFSDVSIGYYYSNQLAKSKPLTTNLEILMNEINEMFGSSFNGILINRYANGSEFISPHSDDEKNLDNFGVVSISYGGERIFRIRNKKTKEIEIDIPLNNMDILHMGGNFQKEFTHEIPSTKKHVNVRYSFTFRNHKI
jgi:alkylated DNA repair dioxygenase AlkB